MRAILSRLLDDFYERPLPVPTRRDVTPHDVPGKAQAIVGMRRVGKTWFCFQRMQDLLARGVGREQLVYVNFEDERLLPFQATDFQELLDAFYAKRPALRDQRCHLFLDEVQRIPGWEMFVRRALDSEQLDVWVTGSSSKLLSAEIATSLRGRALATEIFPFSFAEFLRDHGVGELAESSRVGAKTRAVLQNQVERYLEIGGFPEVQNLDAAARRQVLRDYVDIVLLRDVIERHRVSNTVALRALVRHLTAAPASRFSINKFHLSLKSQGIACAKNDLYAFLDHLSDAFFTFLIPIHARSHKARQVNPRKAYLIDTGLLGAMSLMMTENRGQLLENLVFVDLRRRGYAPEYYLTERGGEVDFVLRTSPGERPHLVQVCASLSGAETRRREEASLLDAKRELRASRCTVVTWMEERVPGLDEAIEVVPAWRWLTSALHAAPPRRASR